MTGRYAVCRQDDNGASMTIRRFADEMDAQAFLDELEARGHKQFYWLESGSDSDSEASSSSPARPS